MFINICNILKRITPTQNNNLSFCRDKFMPRFFILLKNIRDFQKLKKDLNIT